MSTQELSDDSYELAMQEPQAHSYGREHRDRHAQVTPQMQIYRTILLSLQHANEPLNFFPPFPTLQRISWQCKHTAVKPDMKTRYAAHSRMLVNKFTEALPHLLPT